ncbi:hypothetical protein [Rhodococcus opacus]|nr:hypothetical protein [Rhodococcus opacus]MDH6293394.1 hypothetical protein [Rhodococcus opacus]
MTTRRPDRVLDGHSLDRDIPNDALEPITTIKDWETNSVVQQSRPPQLH